MKTLRLSITLVIAIFLIAGCISPEMRTARIAINETDWERALSALDAELARTSGSAEAFYLKGHCYEKLSDWERMSLYYDSSLTVSNQFETKIHDSRLRLVSRYYNRSSAAYDSSRFEQALVELDTAIIIDPHDPLLYRQAAITAYYGDLFDVAAGYAMKSIELEKDGEKNLSVREVMLAISRSREEHNETIRWAQELMSEIDPTEDIDSYLRAYDALVAAYMSLGENDKAQEVTKEAINLFPDQIELKMNLALLMIKRKNYDAASGIYYEVLAMDQDNFDANLNIGTILVNEDRWEEAIPYLERAHRTDPQNLITVQNLMAAYYNSEQYEKGEEMKNKLDALTGEE